MSQGGSNYKKTISGVSLYHAYVRGEKKYLHVVHENRTLKCKIRSTHTRSLTDTRSPVCVCSCVSVLFHYLRKKGKWFGSVCSTYKRKYQARKTVKSSELRLYSAGIF